ncbi:MAG: hypothetical protein V4722_17965 [Bacteroidota bacterium]
MEKLYRLFALLFTLYAGPASSQVITTITGTFYGDGHNALAIGITPINQSVDQAGNIYFSEPDRHIVRKLSADGVYSTVAGNGIFGYGGDGALAINAQLKSPYCIARDAAGSVYIADSYDNRIRKVTSAGIITTIAGNGTAGFSGDGGPAIQAQLNGPNGIAADHLGNVYITDFSNYRVRKISAAGIITTIAGTGVFGGAGDGGLSTLAQVGAPLSVAVNNIGELFIGDVALNNVRKVATNGIITTIAGTIYGASGFSGDGGFATSALFNEITGVAADASGNIFIADRSNNRIRRITNGIVNTVAGNGGFNNSGDGGPATAAQLATPQNVTIDAIGNLFISTPTLIRKVSVSGNIINTVAGNGFKGYNGDSLPVAVTQMYQPFSMAADNQNNIYWSDRVSGRIRKLNTNGIVSTIAGTGIPGFSGDGGLATNARLSLPNAIAIDTGGNIFISDFGPRRVRKIGTDGIIITVGGNGGSGFSGDGGPAISAQISTPNGLVADNRGNIFVSDRDNQRVRKIASNGIISTIAGNGTAGFSGDGANAVLASLVYPADLALDTAGNLLISDQGNARVRKVNLTTGIISTIAGNGSTGFSGDGGPAVAAGINPGAIAVDTLGNVFVTDHNGYIRKVNTAGIISSVAGGGTSYGEGVPPNTTQIKAPSGITIDMQGNLYLTDTDNNRIRKITDINCGYWTGSVDSIWENLQNWTCGLLPGITTDVYIPNGNVVINSNITIRSLRIGPGVNMIVRTGFTLTVLN